MPTDGSLVGKYLAENFACKHYWGSFDLASFKGLLTSSSDISLLTYNSDYLAHHVVNHAGALQVAEMSSIMAGVKWKIELFTAETVLEIFTTLRFAIRHHCRSEVTAYISYTAVCLVAREAGFLQELKDVSGVLTVFGYELTNWLSRNTPTGECGITAIYIRDISVACMPLVRSVSCSLFS